MGEGGGTRPVVFADAHSPATTAIFELPGEYVLRLTTTDSEHSVGDEVRVRVEPANAAPSVEAGADQTVYLPASAVLAGGVSDDGLPEGSALSLLWSKVSGPGSVVFADAHAASTAASFSAAGTYVLRLSASDTQLSGADELTVTAVAADQPPAVSAGPAQAITLPANTAALSGVVTDDGLPAGASLTSLWSLAGANPLRGPSYFGDDFDDNKLDSSKWAVTALTGGAQLLERNQRLEIQPGATTSGTSNIRTAGFMDMRERVVTVRIGVNPKSYGQLTRFRIRDDVAATTTWLTVGNGSLSFTADSFFDGDGRGDGTFAFDAETPLWVRYRQFGEYYAWDVSADGANWVTRVETKLYRPVTSAQYLRYETSTPAGAPPLYLDDLTVTAPAWDLIAGPGTVAFADPASPTTAATFGGAGTYRLRLTATDSQYTAAGDVTVTVNQVNHAPVTNAGPDQTVLTSQAAHLSGTVQDEGLPSTGGVSAAWSVVSGPGSVTFANAGSAYTDATFTAPGYYVLRLTGSDTQLSAGDDILVRVVNSFDDGLPGGVFVSGHDSDGHAGGERDGSLMVPAERIMQRAIEYVSYKKASPKILLVTDLRNPGADNGDPRAGLTRAGFTYDVADYGSGQQGALDLHTVNFKNYDVVFVASSYGGWLRQDELDILNTRRAAVMDFVNEGGGLVALAESGGRLRPDALYPGVTRDHYRFLPIQVSTVQLQEVEKGGRITPAGLALGLTSADMVNSTENYFTTTGGMDVIDLSPAGNVTTLAYRGRRVNLDGSSNEAPVVYAGPDRIVTMPHAASLAGVATDDALPAGSNLSAQWSVTNGPGAVTFAEPNRAATTATFGAPGAYTLRLTATDGGLTTFSETHVTVNPTGQYVVVSVGADQTIRLPKTAALSASVADGRVSQAQPLARAWTKVSGPASVTFSAPNALGTTAAFGSAGVYVLRFSAGDAGYTGSDDLTVNVRPAAPIFGDDFNDNTPDPAKWFYGPGFSERSQQLQVDVPAQLSLPELNSAVRVDMRDPGAFVAFEIPDYADPAFNNKRVIIWRMQVAEGNWHQFVYQNNATSFSHNGTLLRSVSGLHARYWRLIHRVSGASDFVGYETSEDGANWTQRTTSSPSALDSLTFRLIVGSQGTAAVGSGSAGVVKLDNVNTNVPVVLADHRRRPSRAAPTRPRSACRSSSTAAARPTRMMSSSITVGTSATARPGAARPRRTPTPRPAPTPSG